jgi:hypothetical protein
MLRIMSDNDVQGYVERLVEICQAPPWVEFWQGLDCSLCGVEDFDLPANAADSRVWQVCQDNGIILITGNRNSEGPESLNSTIETRNGPESLPVLTLASAKRIARDRHYAQLVVERLFDTLINVEILRGTGRLFLP